MDKFLSLHRFQKIQKIVLCNNTFSSDDVKILLQKENERKLHTLIIENVDLSRVNPDILAKVVLTLKTVVFYSSKLTRIQTATLFRIIANEDKKQLETLKLVCNNLSKSNSKILAGAVLKLKNVNLFYTKLTPHQV